MEATVKFWENLKWSHVKGKITLRQIFKEQHVKAWSGFMRLRIRISGGKSSGNFSVHIKGGEFVDQLWNFQFLRNDYIRNFSHTCLEFGRRAFYVLSWPHLHNSDKRKSVYVGQLWILSNPITTPKIVLNVRLL
jgi:hypothetical protein